MNRKHHSALAKHSKFRAGVAPIRLETGRYDGLEVDDCICPICKNEIETVITRCPSYSVPRDILYNECTQLYDDFNSFTDIKKLCFILSNPDICIY